MSMLILQKQNTVTGSKRSVQKKKVVIKFSRRKDTNNIRAEKEAKG